MKNKVLKVVRQVLGLFPSRLPQGMTEFNAWADSLGETYELPTKDQDSIRFMLATAIMHLGPQAARKPKFFFALMLQAAAAKQVAAATFQEIKTRQQEAAKAAAATALPESVANASPQA